MRGKSGGFMARVPNVVLLNEHPAEQAFLRYFLSSQGIASCSLSSRAGLDALAALSPDVVILADLRLRSQGSAPPPAGRPVRSRPPRRPHARRERPRGLLSAPPALRRRPAHLHDDGGARSRHRTARGADGGGRLADQTHPSREPPRARRA